LIGWYLKELESEIESEAELVEKKTVVEKVIERLVHHVSIKGTNNICLHWKKFIFFVGVCFERCTKAHFTHFWLGCRMLIEW
jgi:hypothetical protein